MKSDINILERATEILDMVLAVPEREFSMVDHACRILTLQKYIDELGKIMLLHQFTSPNDEVMFFKEVMPVLYGEMFLSRYLFSFETMSAYKTENQIKDYCVALLGSMEKFAA